MKPCHVLNRFLTFWHLKPYVLIRLALIKYAYSLFPSAQEAGYSTVHYHDVEML